MGFGNCDFGGTKTNGCHKTLVNARLTFRHIFFPEIEKALLLFPIEKEPGGKRKAYGELLGWLWVPRNTQEGFVEGNL